MRDLTGPDRPGFSSTAGLTVYQPRPWGGVPGIFQRFTAQAGLNYDVAIASRGAASLRGHLLNTNGQWDLRSNIASQRWDRLVLQEQSDGPLPFDTTRNARPAVFQAYAIQLAQYARSQSANQPGFTETALFGCLAACRSATGSGAGACNEVRPIPGNPNTNPATRVTLYQTWARPNLIAGGVVTTTDATTGAVTRTTTPITGPYPAAGGPGRMTANLAAAQRAARDARPDVFENVAPVGEAFLRAVLAGVATRGMYAPDAETDGLIDLWFADGLHASKLGSYLRALTLFGTITGLAPQSLDGRELAARELGITPTEAWILQRVAAETLGLPVPVPAGLALFLPAVAALAAARRRRA